MKKPISLRWKIARTLLLFAVFIIGVLFVFEEFLLEPMYEDNKISTVKSVSDSIVAILQQGDEISEEVLFQYQM